MRHVTEAFDKGGEGGLTAIGRACLDELGLSGPRDLVARVYRSEEAPAVRIASLAPFVLRRADAGDELALEILCGAARHLAGQLGTVRRRLDDAQAPIAFAGGLLESENLLSSQLAKRLPCRRAQPPNTRQSLAPPCWRRWNGAQCKNHELDDRAGQSRQQAYRPTVDA